MVGVCRGLEVRQLAAVGAMMKLAAVRGLARDDVGLRPEGDRAGSRSNYFLNNSHVGVKCGVVMVILRNEG